MKTIIINAKVITMDSKLNEVEELDDVEELETLEDVLSVEEFNISYSDVYKLKDDLLKHADTMRSILDEVTLAVNRVHSNSWESSASAVHLEEYNRLKKTYETFYGDVQNLATFLNAIVEGKQSDDTTVGKIAVNSTGTIVS